MFQVRIKTEFCQIFRLLRKISLLAVYRVGDSPIDVFTPLIVYLRQLQSWRSGIK